MKEGGVFCKAMENRITLRLELSKITSGIGFLCATECSWDSTTMEPSASIARMRSLLPSLRCLGEDKEYR